MSLILTKSTPGHPASYVNRFKNTFEIKSNAEIAVQEVVLNRSSKFVVGPNAQLYVRHGDAANVNTWNVPQVVVLAAGTYEQQQQQQQQQQQDAKVGEKAAQDGGRAAKDGEKSAKEERRKKKERPRSGDALTGHTELYTR